MPTDRSPTRYTTVAILLHWVIALLVIAMVPMGWWMVDAIGDPDRQQVAYNVFQLHKSVGFAILALTLVRLVWRLTHPAPALPAGMKPWEAFLARATHVAFYGLLVGLPLTGWIYVSAGWAVATDRPLNVATSWFGLFPVPHLPGFDADRAAAHGAIGAHALLAWGGVVLLALHAGAALKHQFIDRDGVLAQMIPFLRRTGAPEHAAVPRAAAGRPAASGGASTGFGAGLGAGIGAVVAVAAAGWLLYQPAPLAPSPTPAVAAAETPAPAPTAVAHTSEATARAWSIDRAASSIAFAGTHTGSPFTGRFEDWEGDIRFDPDDLAGSRVVVLIRTGSARTGDATQESSLQAAEWLDPSAFPQARFEASTFRSLGGDRYEAQGTLTIKDKPYPVVLPFSLTIDDTGASVTGEVELDRTALDLGMFSDPTADWVSRAIRVIITVSATPAPPA